jgi:hypothetical protein
MGAKPAKIIFLESGFEPTSHEREAKSEIGQKDFVMKSLPVLLASTAGAKRPAKERQRSKCRLKKYHFC